MKRPLLAFIILIACAAPALADIDYSCLNACIRNGDGSGNCMKSCTYIPPLKERGLTRGPKKDAHDQFSSLHRSDKIRIEKKAITPELLNKNYSCVMTCLKNGMQYQLCQNACTAQGDAK